MAKLTLYVPKADLIDVDTLPSHIEDNDAYEAMADKNKAKCTEDFNAYMPTLMFMAGVSKEDALEFMWDLYYNAPTALNSLADFEQYMQEELWREVHSNDDEVFLRALGMTCYEPSMEDDEQGEELNADDEIAYLIARETTHEKETMAIFIDKEKAEVKLKEYIRTTPDWYHYYIEEYNTKTGLEI